MEKFWAIHWAAFLFIIILISGCLNKETTSNKYDSEILLPIDSPKHQSRGVTLITPPIWIRGTKWIQALY